MAVVAAGVHQSLLKRRMTHAALFIDRQGIHVRPDGDVGALFMVSTADDTHHAALANAGFDPVTSKFRKVLSDLAGGAQDIELQFGMLVKIVAPMRGAIDEVS
jgi:hypothetical protein